MVQHGIHITEAIQVCFDLNNKNMEREMNGLLESMNYYHMEKGIMITQNQKNSFYQEGKQIHIVPAYEFLIGYS